MALTLFKSRKSQPSIFVKYREDNINIVDIRHANLQKHTSIIKFYSVWKVLW